MSSISTLGELIKDLQQIRGELQYAHEFELIFSIYDHESLEEKQNGI